MYCHGKMPIISIVSWKKSSFSTVWLTHTHVYTHIYAHAIYAGTYVYMSQNANKCIEISQDDYILRMIHSQMAALKEIYPFCIIHFPVEFSFVNNKHVLLLELSQTK